MSLPIIIAIAAGVLVAIAAGTRRRGTRITIVKTDTHNQTESSGE